MLTNLFQRKPLDISAQEIEEMALKSANSRGFRRLELIVNHRPIRALPQDLINISRDQLDLNRDPEKVLRYILNAFYIYRQTVATSAIAPVYEISKVYEWPQPTGFSWKNLDIIIATGEVIHGEIPERQSVKVERKSSPGDDFPKSFKFHIEDARKIGFVNQYNWQNQSLHDFVNPLYDVLLKFTQGKLSKKNVIKYLQNGLSELERPYQIKLGTIRRWYQKSNGLSLI